MHEPGAWGRTEWLLATTRDDDEEAPWMTMRVPSGRFQWRVIALLMSILRRYVQEAGLRWYVAAELKVTMPRRVIPRHLDLGPDVLMVEADDRSRDSWHVEREGGPPFFVLEVVTPDSGGRDTRDKPALYESMGVQEYLIFAPRRKRAPKLSGYHRTASGLWRPWQADARGQVRSTAAGGLFFYAEEDGGTLWLRVRDARGRRLLSDGEAADLEARRALEEETRAMEEGARADAAEAEVARLRAMLAGGAPSGPHPGA